MIGLSYRASRCLLAGWLSIGVLAPGHRSIAAGTVTLSETGSRSPSTR